MLEIQKEHILQLNELDEYRQQALSHTEMVHRQKKQWHDKKIRTKKFKEGDWESLYDSIFQKFKGNLTTG